MTQLMTQDHMFIADPTVYTVERLLRKRKRHGSFEYLVKWRDYNFRFNSWEPESNILDQRLVEEFEHRCKQEENLYTNDDDSDEEVMSDLENNESLANKSGSKRKRVTRASARQHTVAKEEDPASEEEQTPVFPTEQEPFAPKEEILVEKEESAVSSPSNVRNLRRKTISALPGRRPPVRIPVKPASAPRHGKLSALLKRTRKQAQSYGMQFSRTSSTSPAVPVKGREWEGEGEEEEMKQEPEMEQTGSDETTDSSKAAVSRSPKEKKKKRRSIKEEKKEKNRTPKDSGESEESSGTKRQRPSRACAVPSGFWNPAVRETGDSSDGEQEEEEVLRPVQRMKNFQPAPSSFYSCMQHDETPTDGTNDLGISIFPKKKFTLKPPTLDISKKPISEFVFKIDDLWASKIHESSVEANGYTVKILECKSSKALFTKDTDIKTKQKTVGT